MAQTNVNYSALLSQASCNVALGSIAEWRNAISYLRQETGERAGDRELGEGANG